MSAVINKSCDHRLREISVALSRPNLDIDHPRKEPVWIPSRSVPFTRRALCASSRRCNGSSRCIVLGLPFVSALASHGWTLCTQVCNAAHRRALELSGQLSGSPSDAKSPTQGTHVLPLTELQVHALGAHGSCEDVRSNQATIEAETGLRTRQHSRASPKIRLSGARGVRPAFAGVGDRDWLDDEPDSPVAVLLRRRLLPPAVYALVKVADVDLAAAQERSTTDCR
jgi:hypothetical protein